jgi:hypothetical protein
MQSGERPIRIAEKTAGRPNPAFLLFNAWVDEGVCTPTVHPAAFFTVKGLVILTQSV